VARTKQPPDRSHLIPQMDNRLTCAEAASRLGIAHQTLYRRLVRAMSRGAIHVTERPVSGVWLLSWECWQSVAATAGPKGRHISRDRSDSHN
jgi:hypothetical protein